MKKKILTLITSIAVTFILIEGLLGIFLPQDKSFIEFNEDLLYKGHPNVKSQQTRSEYTYKINLNNKGWRDKNYNFEKDSKNKRILILGDSMAFGQGIDEEYIFPTIIENKGGTEVINLAFPGYGFDKEVKTLEKFGKEYDPDIIIFAFYMGNDLEDSTNLANLENGKLIWREHFDNSPSLQTRIIISRYSHIYNLITKIIRSKDKISTQDYYLNLENEDKMNKALERTKKIIQYLKDITDKDLRFIIIPPKEVMSEEIFSKSFKEGDITIKDYKNMEKEFTKILENEKIRYMNLRKEGLNNNESYFFKEDIHLTKEGHEKIADIIIDKWREIFENENN